MRVDTYGLLCLIAGLLYGDIVNYFDLPWFINITIGIILTMFMLGFVSKKVYWIKVD